MWGFERSHEDARIFTNPCRRDAAALRPVRVCSHQLVRRVVSRVTCSPMEMGYN